MPHKGARPSLVTEEMKGRPQCAHIGPAIGDKADRQAVQKGTRLALSSNSPQMRHGAGKTTDASAPASPRIAASSEFAARDMIAAG